jgi:hypothetical protein
MSQAVSAQPRPTIAPRRRVSGLVIAVITLAVVLAVTLAVFAWTAISDTDPAPATIPVAEPGPTPASVPVAEAETLPTDSGPFLLEECQARRPCRF